MTGLRRDEGRLSVYFAVVFTAIVVLIGLTVDGAGRIQARQRANHIAAEAARTAGQAIIESLAVQGQGRVIHETRAAAAADAYLQGVPGVVEKRTTFPGSQVVRVVVVIDYDVKMLSFFVGSTIRVTGSATAQLTFE